MIGLNASRDRIPQLILENIRKYSQSFKTVRVEKMISRIINSIASIWRENMLGYLSADVICSSKFTVFLKLRSRKTVRFSEQVMSADIYPDVFSCQIYISDIYIYISGVIKHEGKCFYPVQCNVGKK